MVDAYDSLPEDVLFSYCRLEQSIDFKINTFVNRCFPSIMPSTAVANDFANIC